MSENIQIVLSVRSVQTLIHRSHHAAPTAETHRPDPRP